MIITSLARKNIKLKSKGFMMFESMQCYSKIPEFINYPYGFLCQEKKVLYFIDR